MKKRIDILDYIKAVAMLFVVYLHCDIATVNSLQLGYPFLVLIPVPFLMMLSGYTFSMSFAKGGETVSESVKSYYQPRKMLSRYGRFVIPMLPIYLLRVVKNIVIDHDSIGITDVVLGFFVAGNGGPGSYYFPSLLVLVLIFPVIFAIIHGGGTRTLYYVSCPSRI